MNSKKYLILFLLISPFFLMANIIDKKTITDWSNVGNHFVIPTNAKKISITKFGGKADNLTDNSIALQNAIKSFNGEFGIILFPDGNFMFKKTISIPSNILIKGNGSNKTIFNFNLGGNGDLFSIQGKITNITTTISSGTLKDSKVIKVANSSSFKIGDYCAVRQSADYLLYSNWAYNYFFQIVKITAINGNAVTLESPLHLDFPDKNNPTLVKLNPVEHVGIESIKIKRLDNTNVNQTSNVFFNYAVNCWIKGVEFENTNYAHITLQSTANTTISGNYIHDAFDYGSGGKAYGVVLQFGATDNFIYDNIAKHLRHSFLLQATANGNAIAYNYSSDPFWKETWLPDNAAGDIVLHGNYPYSNLIEGNIIQNLVIDNSHGVNGPFNTFFRNRIENYGIVMNGNAGEHMNAFANEITGSGILKGLYGFTGDNIEISNNIKGRIQDGSILESTLINKNYSSKIGAPNLINSWKNEAYIRSSKVIKTITTTIINDIKTEEIRPTKNTSDKPYIKTTKKECCKKKCKKKAKA